MVAAGNSDAVCSQSGPSGRADLKSPEALGVARETAAETARPSTVKLAPGCRSILGIQRKKALDDVRDGANAWIQNYIIGTLSAKGPIWGGTGSADLRMTFDRMVLRGGAIVNLGRRVRRIGGDPGRRQFRRTARYGERLGVTRTMKSARCSRAT